MRSFKIIKSIIFILILVLCSRLLTYLLYPISSLNRHFINYHTQKDNIDFLVLGSSLEGDGINADVISKEFDQTAFVFYHKKNGYQKAPEWARKFDLEDL